MGTEPKTETKSNKDTAFNEDISEQIKRLDQNISLIRKIVEHTHVGRYNKVRWISLTAREVCEITACASLTIMCVTSSILYCWGVGTFVYSLYKGGGYR